MRWGLVLGGGGVLGGAWMVGALCALQDVHGLDPRDAQMIVGTSAGSLMSALLGAGVSTDELRSHQLGEGASSGPLAALEWDYETATGGSTPSRPRLVPGSTGIVTRHVRRLRELPPTAVLAALTPEGRGSLATVGRLVHDVLAATGSDPNGWSAHPGVRIMVMDYDSGRRVAFGDETMPAAPLPEAVMASCAIPGWYSPVVIDGVRYVDGGACSSTNVDVLTGHGLDHVFVLAPMVSFAMDHPSNLQARMERAWRSRVTRRCLHEVDKLHASGTDVTVVGPGPEDLQAMGANLMSVERRRTVLDTAMHTTVAALKDPQPIEVDDRHRARWHPELERDSRAHTTLEDVG
ncbi:MAG TPA: patatin-like phospholipase family protein [Actinomycetales bacterium]|nr:patatin-like phospholipase family protein [Actinomycetales bacterium]